MDHRLLGYSMSCSFSQFPRSVSWSLGTQGSLGFAPATGSFLQRAPFEVWDVEAPDNPRQINVAWYDRGADGSRDEGSVEYHNCAAFGQDDIQV